MSLLARRVMPAGEAGTPGGGGGGGSFDPWDASHPTPLHAVWAGDPDWSDPGDGNAVSSWRNESGGGNPAQATGANQPTYRASTTTYNNKPTVNFDIGNDDWLHVDITNKAEPFVYVVVANTAGANSTTEIIMGHVNVSGHGFGDHSSDAWKLQFDHGGTADSDPHVFTVVWDGASSEMYVDGSLVVSGDSESDGLIHWSLGAATTGGSQPITGHIAYAGIYDKGSRDADIQALESALGTHYDITIS